MNYLRESDKTCHELADIQARIFVSSVDDSLPSPYFIRAYLSLDEVVAMDDLSFLYGNLSEQDVYAIAKSRLKKRSGGSVYSPQEMRWIGYFYRCLAYITGFRSKKLLTLVPPHYLRSVYDGYHSLDVVTAVGKVLQDRGIVYEDDQTRLKRIIRESYRKEDTTK